MRVIVDLNKKSLKVIENERSIFRGEYGADKLILLINKQLVDEYPIITALLSNGRKIGPYSTDESYGSETIGDVTYTTAEFTLSKENGFTLSEGKMQVTIWMNNANGRKEAIGNLLLNVINTTAFDDGDIIISGDVEGTLVNYRVELENLQGQVNTFNGRLTNVETNKADVSYVNNMLESKADKSEIPTKLSQLEKDIEIGGGGVDEEQVLDIVKTNHYNKNEIDTKLNVKSDKTYVDGKFDQILGEGASSTLDTIGEISKAIQEHNDEYDSLLAVVGNKADKTEIPTKLSQLEQDVEFGVNEEEVLEIIKENSEQVDMLSIGTSDAYDSTSDVQIPTTKAVKAMIGSSGSTGNAKIYRHNYLISIRKYNGTGSPYGNFTYEFYSTKNTLLTRSELAQYFSKILTRKEYATNCLRIWNNANDYDFLIIQNDYYGSHSINLYPSNNKEESLWDTLGDIARFVEALEILETGCIIEEV